MVSSADELIKMNCVPDTPNSFYRLVRQAAQPVTWADGSAAAAAAAAAEMIWSAC
jgi:hypothetical protein